MTDPIVTVDTVVKEPATTATVLIPGRNIPTQLKVPLTGMEALTVRVSATEATLAAGHGTGTGGGLNIPGVSGITYTPGILSLLLADGSRFNIGGTSVAAPPVLPPGTTPGSLMVVNIAPGTAIPDFATALLVAKDGATINVAPGHYEPVHWGTDNGFTKLIVQGAGAYRSIIDGSGGKRLAYQNGGFHSDIPDLTIKGLGFLNCNGGDTGHTGKAGIYWMAKNGKLLVGDSAFDGCENGIMAFTDPDGGTSSDMTTDNNDFGQHVPNGTDGMAHDIYAEVKGKVTHTRNRHYDALRGHAIKVRAPRFASSGNWYYCDSGEGIDLCDGLAVQGTSDNDTFVIPASANANMFAYAEESQNNGHGGFLLTNTKLYIGRFSSAMYANDPATTAAVIFRNSTIVFTDPAASLDLHGNFGGDYTKDQTLRAGSSIGSAPARPLSPL